MIVVKVNIKWLLQPIFYFSILLNFCNIQDITGYSIKRDFINQELMWWCKVGCIAYNASMKQLLNSYYGVWLTLPKAIMITSVKKESCSRLGARQIYIFLDNIHWWIKPDETWSMCRFYEIYTLIYTKKIYKKVSSVHQSCIYVIN